MCYKLCDIQGNKTKNSDQYNLYNDVCGKLCHNVCVILTPHSVLSERVCSPVVCTPCSSLEPAVWVEALFESISLQNHSLAENCRYKTFIDLEVLNIFD